jgi:hypothetical protein
MFPFPFAQGHPLERSNFMSAKTRAAAAIKKPAAKKTFETCRIELKIRSAHFFTNYINKITPPEFLILQHLHGAEGVKFIETQGPCIFTRMNESGKWMKRPVTPAELLEKLTIKYGAVRIKAVFPGVNPILPFTFDAITVGPEEEKVEEESAWEEMTEDELSEAELERLTAPGKDASEDDLVGKKTG